MKVVKPNIKGIEKAVKEIINGKIVFIPTDTVYGIAASPYNENAIKKIFSIKNIKMKYEKRCGEGLRRGVGVGKPAKTPAKDSRPKRKKSGKFRGIFRHRVIL